MIPRTLNAKYGHLEWYATGKLDRGNRTKLALLYRYFINKTNQSICVSSLNILNAKFFFLEFLVYSFKNKIDAKEPKSSFERTKKKEKEVDEKRIAFTYIPK